jgi:hypothetical protein
MSSSAVFQRYDGIETDADAILDVVLIANYRDGALSRFEPSVGVRTRMVGVKDGRQRMDRAWSYGALTPMGIVRTGEWTILDADSRYRLDSDQLMNNPQTAVEGLRTGISLIATRVSEALQR